MLEITIEIFTAILKMKNAKGLLRTSRRHQKFLTFLTRTFSDMLCCKKPYVTGAMCGFCALPIEKIPASKKPFTPGGVY